MASARAGVDVRILLPDEHTDAKPIRLDEPPLLRGAAGGGREDLRVPAHDDARQDVVVDGRGRWWARANMDIRSKELNRRTCSASSTRRSAARRSSRRSSKDLKKRGGDPASRSGASAALVRSSLSASAHALRGAVLKRAFSGWRGTAGGAGCGTAAQVDPDGKVVAAPAGRRQPRPSGGGQPRGRARRCGPSEEAQRGAGRSRLTQL